MPPDTVLGKTTTENKTDMPRPLCIHSRPNMDLGCISHHFCSVLTPPPAIPARTLLLRLWDQTLLCGCVVRNLCFAALAKVLPGTDAALLLS